MIAAKYLVRHLLSTQQAFEGGELETAYWLPGAENPAEGLTKAPSGMVPPLRPLESGRVNPGYLRPLKGVARRE